MHEPHHLSRSHRGVKYRASGRTLLTAFTLVTVGLLTACSEDDPTSASTDSASPAEAEANSSTRVAKVTVSPSAATVEVGTTKLFTAVATNRDGTTLRPSLRWTATGGTVDSSGRYQAGKTTGKFRLIVAAPNGVADTALVTVAAPVASAGSTQGLLFNDAFAGLSLWRSREACCAHSQTIVSSTAREGSTAVRFELRRSDPSGHNLANHIDQVVRPILTGWSGNINGPFKHGQEVWFGFSVYLPADWVNDAASQREILFEVHDTPDNKPGTTSPNWSVAKTAFFYLLAEGGNFVWVNRWDDCAYGTSCWKPNGVERRPYTGPLKKGGWTDFVVHAKWDYRQNGPGLLEIWRDGQKVTTQFGPNAYNQQNPGFFKLGPYKWSWSNTAITKRVVYYDAVRIGGSSSNYASVAPR